MRSVVELAENQQGGLFRGDRLIAPGTVPDDLGFVLDRLRFEQMCLANLLRRIPGRISPDGVQQRGFPS